MEKESFAVFSNLYNKYIDVNGEMHDKPDYLCLVTKGADAVIEDIKVQFGHLQLSFIPVSAEECQKMAEEVANDVNMLMRLFLGTEKDQ